MKNLFFLYLFLALFTTTVFSQAPERSTGKDDDVVKISSSLIRFDITVTDEKGKPVTDIKRDELELFQNGKKQEITDLSFIAGRQGSDIRTNDLPAKFINDNKIKVENVRRTIAIVVDDLTLSTSSMYWVKKAVKKFVNTQMQDGDLVAIIRTGAGVGALQQFTMDKQQLINAADNIKYSAFSAPFNMFFPVVQDSENARSPKRPEDMEMTQFRENVFATGSLGALNYVVKGMQDLPGRKSVILLSEGIPLVIFDGKSARSTGVYLGLKRLVDFANRSSVVIYGVDPVGVEIPGTISGGMMFDRDRKQSLRLLSEETGGFAVVDQNDLSRGISRILEDQSYYLVAYEPDDDTFDPKITKFNQIKVNVLRPDVKVRYRSGFMGFSEDNANKSTLPPKNRMINALTSPFALNEISLDLNALFSLNEKKKPYLRTLIHLGPGELAFKEQPDGKYRAAFDLVAMTFGDQGTVSDEMSKEFTVEVSKNDYESIQKNGFVYDFDLQLKSAGPYQVRVVVRDHETDKIGSANQFIDVPTPKKDRLLLSSAFLENLTLSDWEKMQSGQAPEPSGVIEPLRATASRQFKAGTVLKYAFSVFNAKMTPNRETKLTYVPKLYLNGKLIYTGRKVPLVVKESADYRSLETNGTIKLLDTFSTGEYMLQLEVTDELRGEKKGIADQFIQFDMIE